MPDKRNGNNDVKEEKWITKNEHCHIFFLVNYHYTTGFFKKFNIVSEKKGIQQQVRNNKYSNKWKMKPILLENKTKKNKPLILTWEHPFLYIIYIQNNH